MSELMLFGLPAVDMKPRASVVEAVPSHWKWIHGTLYFPPDQERFRQIAYGTGYLINRYNNSQPAIVGSPIPGSVHRHKPDLLGLMIENKLPSFVTFEMAGFAGEEDFKSARSVASAYLRRGYIGCLRFVKSDHKNNFDENPATCLVCIKAGGKEQSEVRLSWASEFGGKPSDIADIVQVCYNIGLTPNRSAGIEAFT